MKRSLELVPYACHDDATRGRLFDEPESRTRGAFQRDRDRIIHSTAFRRLQYKTQVFVYHEGDHYRTRLTHSLEVSQIARSICRYLGLNEDLTEALALAHDLGHTPFGHAGEEALDREMAVYGGFDHNAQTLRILTKLESRYPEFDGLNPTWEVLEGVVKHNGPLLEPDQDPATLPAAIAEYNEGHDLELHTFAGAEAQAAALADDIAYNNHDIDDGLRAELFAIDDLLSLPLVGQVFTDILARYPGLDRRRATHEAVRHLISLMVEDLLAESERRIAAANPKTVAGVRALDRPLIAFSEEMQAADRALKNFLHERMYRHSRVNEMTSEAQGVVSELFRRYTADPETLPREWRRRDACERPMELARRTADFIAGMTDRYALAEHRRIVDN